MGYELEGKLHKKFDIETKGTNGFKSREFVVLTQGEYPQYVKFQIVQDRCELLDNVQEGTDVKVYFDLRGREWDGKFFTNLNAWKVEYSAATNQDAPF